MAVTRPQLKPMRTLFCPTCGKASELTYSPEWLMGHFNGLFVGVLAVLLEGRRKRRGVSIKEIAKYIYADIDTGIDPEQNARVLLTHNKKRLHKLGWHIAGGGNTGNGYWLVPIDRTD